MKQKKSFIEVLFDGEYAPYDSIHLPEPQYTYKCQYKNVEKLRIRM